ncbi:MAG TPA: hypothetical protein VG713_16125, partial [Pirellulales bacterium]|nr:hypothetical protein [Pirellulales bacterium]
MFAYHRLNDEIRRRVEQRLSAHYSNLIVTVRSARLQSDGIEIRGIAIFEPVKRGPHIELLRIDELLIRCEVNPVDMLRDRLDITQIVARRPTLRLTHHVDGTWSGPKLLPIPQFSDRPPDTTIELGAVEIVDAQCNPPKVFHLRDANVSIAPVQTARASSRTTPLRLQGMLAADSVRQIAIDATFDPATGAWHTAGTIEGMHASSEWLRSLPGSLSCPTGLDGLRTDMAAKFSVAYDAKRSPALDFDVAGRFEGGRLDDRRLPLPLTELSGQFRCTPAGCVLEQASARCGRALLRLDAEKQGYDERGRVHLRGQAQQLVLEPKFRDLLPPGWQAEWDKYEPAGEVNLDVSLAYDGKSWQPEIVCQCVNASFLHYKFPYRLDRARGTLDLKQGLLTTNLVAMSEDAELKIVSSMQVNVSPAVGWVEIRGEQLRFDEKLLAAMPEATRRVVRSLNAFGRFSMFSRFYRDSSAIEHRELAMSLDACSMKFDRFPYPLDNIRGTIEMHDGIWSFRDLQGRNGTGSVTCSGQILPAEQGAIVQLHLLGSNILLEDELREALNPAARQLWHDLKPQGSINLETRVQFESGTPGPQLWIRAEPVGETVSIEPARFPYRFEKLSGVFVFADGKVAIDRLRAEHGRTQVIGRGQCELFGGGGWRLSFEQMSVDRLPADRDLIFALPGKLKKSLADLNVQGAVNLRGSLSLASDGSPDAPFSSTWDVQLDLHGNTADVGILLENVHGGLHLVGDSVDAQFRCEGTFDLDSALYKQMQFTCIRGPLWIDETRLLLGFWADRARAAPVERHASAQFCGGGVTLDGWTMFGEQSTYEFHLALARANLAQWKMESQGGRADLHGLVNGQVVLRGQGKSLNNLSGHGTLELRDADIYQSPFMVGLLKILGVRQPDVTVFTSGDVKFRIQGEHAYVDRIDFNGGAISLLGKGEVGLNKQIHLVFHAVVGSDRLRIPVVSEVMGGASQQIMLIHAEGTLD